MELSKSPIEMLFCILLFCSVSGETEPVKCVIVPLSMTYASAVSTEAMDSHDTNGTALWNIILTDNELEFETVLHYVSNLFHSDRTYPGAVRDQTTCDDAEVVGVVGDLGSKTASILHTLASRFNITLTL